MGVAFFMNNEHDNEAHKANAFVMHMKNTSYFKTQRCCRQSCEEAGGQNSPSFENTEK